MTLSPTPIIIMTTHFRVTTVRRAVIAVALALSPSLAGAQPRGADVAGNAPHVVVALADAPQGTSNAKPSGTTTGPRLAPSGLRMERENSRPNAPVPRDPGANVGPNLALMGVGAAAVVVGLLIGGDGGNAVAVGGAVVGLVGLYRYMR